MIYGKDKLADIFERIQDVFNQTHTQVVIMAAADCDSICTTKILTELLKAEDISYLLYPVLSYEHIAQYNDETLQLKIKEDELHSIIMINCGAIVDLNHMLFIRPIQQQYHEQKQLNHNNNDNDDDDDIDIDDPDDNEDETEKMNEYISNNIHEPNDKFTIYVIDSHRPFHLNNVYEPKLIYLLQGDDEQALNEFPKLIDDDDNDDGNDNDNGDNSDDNDFDIDDDDDDLDIDIDSDNDNSNKPLQRNKRRKLNNGSYSGSNDNNSNNVSESIRLRREQDNYYKYQYYSLNSSDILYTMALVLQKDDNNMLWYTILGLTESFIYNKINRASYNESITKYCDCVSRRNQPYNNVSTMDTEVRYNLNDNNTDNSSIVSHRLRDHIQFSSEFRFTLMRYWTLYNSMYYSRYIATTLGVWKERGRDNLKYIFAKMALPLNEVNQPYNNMKREYKQKLPKLFDKFTKDQGLDNNLTFGSFTKQHGGHSSISASDFVYSITAVLESDFKVRYNADYVDNNSSNKNDNDNDIDYDDISTDNMRHNFFFAYDCLVTSNQLKLASAIELAKKRQRNIIDMGIKLIEKRDIKSIGIMRYCKIDYQNSFQSPMLLCKLGLFIMDAFRAQTTKNSKPFILASYNCNKNTYIVVGIQAQRHDGDIRKSPFYNAFDEARKRVNASAKIVFFEGHVIEIHKDHFSEWLENLHERLIDYTL